MNITDVKKNEDQIRVFMKYLQVLTELPASRWQAMHDLNNVKPATAQSFTIRAGQATVFMDYDKITRTIYAGFYTDMGAKLFVVTTDENMFGNIAATLRVMFNHLEKAVLRKRDEEIVTVCSIVATHVGSEGADIKNLVAAIDEHVSKNRLGWKMTVIYKTTKYRLVLGRYSIHIVLEEETSRLFYLYLVDNYNSTLYLVASSDKNMSEKDCVPVEKEVFEAILQKIVEQRKEVDMINKADYGTTVSWANSTLKEYLGL